MELHVSIECVNTDTSIYYRDNTTIGNSNAQAALVSRSEVARVLRRRYVRSVLPGTTEAAGYYKDAHYMATGQTLGFNAHIEQPSGYISDPHYRVWFSMQIS